MEKTLEQLIQDMNKKNKELDDLEDQIVEVLRPGTILKLQEPLYNNFKTRIDQELVEQDFACVVVVSVPGHGFSLMDIEGSLLKSHGEKKEETEGANISTLEFDDPVTLVRNYPGTIVGHVSDQITRFIKGKR